MIGSSCRHSELHRADRRSSCSRPCSTPSPGLACGRCSWAIFRRCIGCSENSRLAITCSTSPYSRPASSCSISLWGSCNSLERYAWRCRSCMRCCPTTRPIGSGLPRRRPTSSMFGLFLNLYAALRMLRARRPPVRFLWGGLSVLALLLSGLAYEVALPLFLLNGALIWQRSNQSAGSPRPCSLPCSSPSARCGLQFLLSDRGRCRWRLAVRAARIGAGLLASTCRSGLFLPFVLWTIVRYYAAAFVLPWRWQSALSGSAGSRGGMMRPRRRCRGGIG